ncbi:MAG: protein kinase [Myxococcales bacterium]|nr:protein kinase [Myxococcales bacterium]
MKDKTQIDAGPPPGSPPRAPSVAGAPPRPPTVSAAATPPQLQPRPATSPTPSQRSMPGAERSAPSSPQTATAAIRMPGRIPPRAAAEPPDEFAPGTIIDRFEVIREIARGGMGRVHLARDTKLGRRVALKFLLNVDERLTSRFLVEARTTAQCTHENIVVIYEVGEYHASPYMVLEYLEGQTLTDILRAEQLTARRAVELMLPVVRALGRAHDHGIVHRDLKPGNIFVTTSGTVKVLDFGIAKLFAEAGATPATLPAKAELGSELDEHTYHTLSNDGNAVGTLPYMSPEQWGADAVDFQSDLYAVGIILFRAITGRHPLGTPTGEALRRAMLDIATPLPSLAQAAPDQPKSFVRLVDRCLAKPKTARFATAGELQAALEAFLAEAMGRAVAVDDEPYRGLAAFHERDAAQFFGRTAEVRAGLGFLQAHPLMAVVGPSGNGKSSFVQAGIIPALKSDDAAWQSLVIRPGRRPLLALAQAVEGMISVPPGTSAEAKIAAITDKLASEPGYLGALLRAHARAKRGRVVLVVDQFEETYTLVANEVERHAFVLALCGAADDAGAPVRVILSMRSDFLDRASENRLFLDELTRGLFFLSPPDAVGLREAIVAPAELAGYRFETPAIADDMVRSLATSAGALPLLQFAAAQLWERRDRTAKMITSASYEAIGGVAGAFAQHADKVVASLPTSARRLAQAMLLRLVTTDGTRAIVERGELHALTADTSEAELVLGKLVEARLLHVEGDDHGATVEIVHEALITRWPTLTRWIEEGKENAAYLAEVRNATKQWLLRGKAADLVWRSEMAVEAGKFLERYQGDLPPHEREFLLAAQRGHRQATRRKRSLVAIGFAILIGIIIVGAGALVTIRSAKTEAVAQAALAKTEAVRAKEAEAAAQKQLGIAELKERERQEAEQKALAADAVATQSQATTAMTRDQLETANLQLKTALAKAKASEVQAEKARVAAEVAKKKAEAGEAEAKRRLKLKADGGKTTIKTEL